MTILDPQTILSGQRRRGVPAGAIITIGVSSLCLAVFLIFLLLLGGGLFYIAAVLSLVTLVPMMAGVMAIDRLEPEPVHLLVTTFLWGAGASVILSLIFESLGGLVMQPWMYDTEFAEVAIAAPIVEESMKALVLLGLFWFRRHEINGITDGVVYACTVALGFAAAENIEYYIIFGYDGPGSLIFTFILRGIMSPFCHPVFTSMTGIALALAIRKRSAGVRFLYVIGGLLVAFLLHGLWNGLAFFGYLGLGIAFIIIVGVMVGILIAVRVDRLRTIARIHDCMEAYIPTGLVTEGDRAMLSTLEHRKHARDWAKANRGKTGFNAMRDYQQACTELTMLHDRANDGLVRPADFEAHRQVLMLLMRMAREAFLGPSYLSAPMVAPVPPPAQLGGLQTT